MASENIPITGHYPIEKLWTDDKKGLKKELVSFQYQSMTKANDLSKCLVSITEIKNLCDEHDTKYLRDVNAANEYWISITKALTPIDCYVELFLKRMMMGETSRCSITTKTGVIISFVIHLIRIEFGGYMYAKDFHTVLTLAQRYKENGVKMFKRYPLFAHDYFNKAAKVLISCEPFETLAEREIGMTEADPVKLRELLENILMNISACLIKQERYDEAAYVMEFADRPENVSDKAIYRRANALYYWGKLDDARQTIERINYKDNKECLNLYVNISKKLAQSDQTYRSMVKKMFNVDL